MYFSIIVPVLNEETVLEEQLVHLTRQCDDHYCEVIIVDGGSSDRTVAIAERFGRVLSSPRGRATQMNAGAGAAGSLARQLPLTNRSASVTQPRTVSRNSDRPARSWKGRYWSAPAWAGSA